MAYSDCDQLVSFFILDQSDFENVFDEHFKVKKKEYAEIMCRAMSQKFYCSFNSDGISDGKVVVSFKLCCNARREKKFIVKYFKGISGKQFEVFSNNLPPCESHQDMPVGRNVTAVQRANLKEELLQSMPLDVCFYIHIIIIISNGIL